AFEHTPLAMRSSILRRPGGSEGIVVRPSRVESDQGQGFGAWISTFVEDARKSTVSAKILGSLRIASRNIKHDTLDKGYKPSMDLMKRQVEWE
ncbi:hypothetical protein V5O48_011459, partial [Marasmius crinis-equi]